MIMGAKIERSAEAVQHGREDRNGWLFALLTMTVSGAIIISALVTSHSWH